MDFRVEGLERESRRVRDRAAQESRREEGETHESKIPLPSLSKDDPGARAFVRPGTSCDFSRRYPGTRRSPEANFLLAGAPDGAAPTARVDVKQSCQDGLSASMKAQGPLFLYRAFRLGNPEFII